jgi:hypothetical protein
LILSCIEDLEAIMTLRRESQVKCKADGLPYRVLEILADGKLRCKRYDAAIEKIFSENEIVEVDVGPMRPIF